MEIFWWHWLAGGLFLIGMELFIPSFTIIWFGLGAVLVGIIVSLFPSFPFTAQILTWTIVSALLTFAWFRFFNPRKNKTFSGSAQGAVIGETCQVPATATGIGRVALHGRRVADSRRSGQGGCRGRACAKGGKN